LIQVVTMDVAPVVRDSALGRTPAEHPLGEYPSRTLFVRNINIHTTDEELLTLFSQCGEVRSMYTACKHRGFVMISYHDIRASTRAKQVLQVRALCHPHSQPVHTSSPSLQHCISHTLLAMAHLVCLVDACAAGVV